MHVKMRLHVDFGENRLENISRVGVKKLWCTMCVPPSSRSCGAVASSNRPHTSPPRGTRSRISSKSARQPYFSLTLVYVVASIICRPIQMHLSFGYVIPMSS